ncbi:hypothetical protein [Azorhizobium doebereinerae]|uniref:hypothetical protein n=1 Tax=Azorhizobium doebereinerae TaxID=281091 RepID=UPI000421936C|nr:hypothetical protein [Azorhizobium doebereinerae]
MAREPDNMIPTLLRELRAHMDARFGKLDGEIGLVKGEVAENSKRLESLRQAMIGESVLGRYTVAEVEQRLEKIESRLAALEKHSQ